jgi:hypothetical protein
MAVDDGQSSAGGGGPADPMAQFIDSVVTAWGQGLQALTRFASRGQDGTDAAMAKPLEVGATAEAAWAQAFDLSPALAQAYLASVGSATRYAGTLAELFVRYEASLMRAATDRATGRSAASPAECRVLADELRAFLREIGDAATREARRLEYDLAKVGELIAQAADQATPSPHADLDRRRHEVKP